MISVALSENWTSAMASFNHLIAADISKTAETGEWIYHCQQDGNKYIMWYNENKIWYHAVQLW